MFVIHTGNREERERVRHPFLSNTVTSSVLALCILKFFNTAFPSSSCIMVTLGNCSNGLVSCEGSNRSKPDSL